MLWKEELRNLIPASILGEVPDHRDTEQTTSSLLATFLPALHYSFIQNWAGVPFQNPMYLASDFCSRYPLEPRVVIEFFVFYR
jgi:hypothetical protein